MRIKFKWIADELRLYQSVLGMRRPRPTPAAMAGLVDEARCPVCGRAVDADTAPTLTRDGRRYLFDGPECQERFREDPERFARGHPGAPA